MDLPRGDFDTEWAVAKAAELHRGLRALLGDDDVLHGVALVLALITLCLGRRLPNLLAFAMSVSVGLWTGLLVQDRLSFSQPILGVYSPKASWEPLAFCVGAALWAGGLVYLAKRTALVLMTAGISVLVVLTMMRLTNIPPGSTQLVGDVEFPTYGVVGLAVLCMAFLVAATSVSRHYDAMIAFNSSHLGLLLAISAVSHFAQRVGAASTPFSLLDDLSRIVAEAKDGRCFLWRNGVVASRQKNLRQCDCTAYCRTEIIAWIFGSWLLFGWRLCRRKTGQGYNAVPLDEIGIGSSGLELSGRGRASKRGRLGRGGQLPTAGPPEPAWTPGPGWGPPAGVVGRTSTFGAGGMGGMGGAGGMGGMGGMAFFDDGDDRESKLRKLRSWLEEGLISLSDFEAKKSEVLMQFR